MNNILSRVITGIIGLIIGGVLNAFIGLIPAYLGQVPKGQIQGYEVAAWFVFPFVGFIIGVCVGAIVGVMQFKVLKGLAVGAGITFFIFILFLSLDGLGDMSDARERKAFFYILSVVILDGCFVSLLVGLVCNGLMKLFFQQNIETDSSLE
jgi:uncharacterized membrane protein YraQ (UPF0718 family)